MMKKRILAAALAALMLAGCGEKSDTQQTQAETQSEPPEISWTASPEMLENAILNMGNGYRLRQKLLAAQAGEDITIAYIGGSITEGPDVQPAQRYVTLSYHEFEEDFARGGRVTCVNAGLSGTPSNLGVLRLRRDVLDKEPDIVFVEFAVNDSQDFQEKQCFESLVRTILEQPNDPAVVLIFNRTENGYTCQSTMGLTGLYYSLPMISVTDAISAELEQGRMTWRDYSGDTVHPNAYGHRLTADFIRYLFHGCLAEEWEAYTLPQTKQYQAPFMNAVMVTPESEATGELEITDFGSFSQFRGNRTGFPVQWRTEGGAPLCFTVRANAVFLVFQRNNSDQMGAVDVYINGEKTMTLQANDPEGWGDPWSTMLVKSRDVETYEIELRPTEDSLGKHFDIYAFAYSQNEKAE